ncbi:MAG: hypothetical protein HYX78_10340 [Armatimonadetes bacterium]|nr:hypothetical protein [Armatimonadota bacterium]
MKHRYLLSALALLIAAIAAIIAGCGGGSSGSATGTFERGTGGGDGSWTVLVYLNADNDLERFGIINFNQMEKVGSNARLNIVVQMDRSPGYDSSNGNWTSTRRYLVTKDGDLSAINSTLIEDIGEVDMGSPETLREFIQWGQQSYPATNYCLIIWNHGSGWRTAPQTITTKNVSFDDTSGTSISTVDLPYALASASPQIDLVAFDASLMQMTEVAYEMRNSATLLVGSEESPPGDGYVYDRWLAPLAASPGMSPRQLGTIIAQEYIKAYTNQYPVTQSLVQLSNVAAVAEAADDLAAAIIPHASTSAAALRTARTSAQAYAFDYYKDLLDYAGLVNQLVPDLAVSAAYSKLQTALSSAVLYEAHTGSEVQRSHGLSIYVPAPSEYLDRYEDIAFSRDYPNWARWLEAQKE